MDAELLLASHCGCLLVAETSLSDLVPDYREQVVTKQFPAAILLIVFTMVPAVGCAVWCGHVWRMKTRGTALALFYRLCKAHSIGIRGRRLLKQIAADASVPHPALLFAGVEYWDACVRSAGQSAGLHRRHAATLGQIRRRLYE